VEALAPAKELYEDGIPGMEDQCAQYMDAVALLEQGGVPKGKLPEEKAALYSQLTDVNRRSARQEKNSPCVKSLRRTGRGWNGTSKRRRGANASGNETGANAPNDKASPPRHDAGVGDVHDFHFSFQKPFAWMVSPVCTASWSRRSNASV